jgi:hypothetical protein
MGSSIKGTKTSIAPGASAPTSGPSSVESVGNDLISTGKLGNATLESIRVDATVGSLLTDDPVVIGPMDGLRPTQSSASLAAR